LNFGLKKAPVQAGVWAVEKFTIENMGIAVGNAAQNVMYNWG